MPKQSRKIADSFQGLRFCLPSAEATRIGHQISDLLPLWRNGQRGRNNQSLQATG